MVTFTNQYKTICYDTERGYCYLNGYYYAPFKREYHAGQIVYRIPKTSKRLSRKQLSKIMNRCEPFEINEIETPF